MPSLYTYTAMRVNMNVRVYKGAPRMRICLHGYPLQRRPIKGAPFAKFKVKQKYERGMVKAWKQIS